MAIKDELRALAWTVLTVCLSISSLAVAIFCLQPVESTIVKVPPKVPATAVPIEKKKAPQKPVQVKKRKRVKKQKVSILTFHDLSNKRTREALVTPRNEFAKMVCQLRTNGYQSFFASQVNALTKGRYLGLKKGCKPVVYTFDDGYRNNYSLLFPLVKKLRVKVTIFLIVGKVVNERTSETGNALTWPEVIEMANSGLVEFGSHTYDLHRNLLSYIKYAGNRKERIKRWRELYHDLRLAKRVLENKLGKPVTTMAWPHGKRSKNHIKLAKKAGYRYVFNTQFGTNVPGYCNYGDLKRISASSRWMSAEALLKRLWYAERGRGLDGKPRHFVWATQ